MRETEWLLATLIPRRCRAFHGEVQETAGLAYSLGGALWRCQLRNVHRVSTATDAAFFSRSRARVDCRVSRDPFTIANSGRSFGTSGLLSDAIEEKDVCPLKYLHSILMQLGPFLCQRHTQVMISESNIANCHGAAGYGYKSLSRNNTVAWYAFIHTLSPSELLQGRHIYHYTGGPHARIATPLWRQTRGGTSSGTGNSTVTMSSLRRPCKYTGTATPDEASPFTPSVSPSGRRVQHSWQRVKALRWSLEKANVLAASLQPAPSSTSPVIGKAMDEPGRARERLKKATSTSVSGIHEVDSSSFKSTNNMHWLRDHVRAASRLYNTRPARISTNVKTQATRAEYQ